jgi:hypothetical protein
MLALRTAAVVELASLVVLLANLATVHWEPVSSAVGPVHGCAYLFVIVLAFRHAADRWTRAAALVPAVGGLLVLRRIAAARLPGGAGAPVRTGSDDL